MFTLLTLMLLMVMFLLGVLTFVSMREHLLSTLLSLEYLVLIIYGLFLMSMCMMNYHIYLCLGFLTFSVCEGALGLSILVSMIRTHGNDYFQSFSILQC